MHGRILHGCLGPVLCLMFVAGGPSHAEELAKVESISEVDRVAALGATFVVDVLSHDQVVEDLALEQEQRDEIEALEPEAEAIAEKFAALYESLPREELLQRSKSGEVLREIRNLSLPVARKLSKILTAKQLVRFREIVCRIAELELFDFPIRDELKLTAEQKAKIDVLIQTCYDEVSKNRSSVPSGLVTPEVTKLSIAMERKNTALERRCLEEVVALLTPEQRERYRFLCGKTFDVDRFLGRPAE